MLLPHSYPMNVSHVKHWTVTSVRSVCCKSEGNQRENMNEAAEESRDNVLINQVVCDDNTKL